MAGMIPLKRGGCHIKWMVLLTEGYKDMLFTILLLEGFITISVEILTIRQLLPFFGGSVVITSIIIGVFLLFLALGYSRGGNRQENFFRQLRRNFSYSMVWIGVGLSYNVIDLFYHVSVSKGHLPFLASLTLYLLLVLAPIVFWLGQTIPLTTNLFNQQHRVAQISGRALFLSTIGSFLGALLTSLLLFQYLGVAWTVVINCALLFGLIIGLRVESHLTWLQGISLFLAWVFIALLNLNAEKIQFKRTNNYANYQVINSRTFDRFLQINRSDSSMLTSDGKGFPYIEFMRDLLFNQLHLQDKSLLIIGAGGFTLTATGTNGNQITYVDIDPDIQSLVESDFLHRPINGTFVAEDARSYLHQYQTRFDVIISDAYTHRTSIPPSLLTIEYFKAIADHLTPNGLLIVNVISDPFFRDDYARIVYNSIHSVFTYCALVPLKWEDPLTNVIYVCPKVKESPLVYRDDLNTSTQDFFYSSRRALGG